MRVFCGFILICFYTIKTLALESRPNVSWGGFFDAQYAYDLNSPPNGDRSFTTQPVRNNEFNINLAHIEAKVDGERVRGRIALQTGTSVQANYSNEPTNGNVSGGSLSRHIQEARIGYQILDDVWVDAGIFMSHTGAETWLSKDNLVLTRSLVADYSPYYLSGFKFLYSGIPHLTAQLLVTNGWQNISENNMDKNMGLAIEYTFESWSVAYNSMFGREVSPPINGVARSGEFRHFHDFIFRSRGDGLLEWIAQFDLGFQKQPLVNRYSEWLGASLMARQKISEALKVSLRLEHYSDKDQVLIVTGLTPGGQFYGGSIGVDQMLAEGLLWRNEVRYLTATEAIFPKATSSHVKTNATITTSLSFVF